MMLAAGPYAVPFVTEAMEAGYQGEYVGAAYLAPLAATYLNMRKTTDLRRFQRGPAQHRRADRAGLREQDMDFNFSDDQEQLRDAVRKWVDRSYTFERRRAIAGAGGFDRAAYGELAELGLHGLYVAEDHGGMGMGPVEAMVVLRNWGAASCWSP
jgi:hypothetical protein